MQRRADELAWLPGRHRDGTVFHMPAFDIPVKCSCGCGDAFNAGIAVAAGFLAAFLMRR